MFNIILFVVFLFLLLVIRLKYFKSRLEKMLLKIPGPDYNIFVGNLTSFRGGRDEIFLNLLKICGKFRDSELVRIWLGSNARIYLLKAESAKAVASDPSNNVKGHAYRYVTPWFRDGLILSSGNKWLHRRRMLTPSFHFKVLEEFRPIMNEQALIFAKMLGSNSDNYFEIYPFASRFSLDTICETAMGVKLGCQIEKSHYYLTAVCSITECIATRLFNIFLHSDFLFKFSKIGRRQAECLRIVHKFTADMIKKRKAEFKQRKLTESQNNDENDIGLKRRLAFMDMLLECQDRDNSIDDDGIQEEVDMFMFAGHDTTASGLSWTLFHIARLPDVQKKIHEELDNVLGDEPVDDISSETLNELRYLECVIKEAFRLTPPVPYFSRKLQKDTDICGYNVPANTDVTFLIQSIHNDPEHWPEPDRFDPNRFLPENSINRHPYAFIPFSAGSRNCIGQKFSLMEMKLALSHVLHRYEVKTRTKLENLTLIAEFVLRTKEGLWLQFQQIGRAHV